MHRKQIRVRLLLIAMSLVLVASGMVGNLATAAEESGEDHILLEQGHEQRETKDGDRSNKQGVSRELEPGPVRDGYDRPVDDDIADFQIIFPPDTRQRVSPTTNYPASAVALIEKRIGGVLFSTCTGTFIGPNVVLTAAHCLYTHEFGWGTSISVIPGKDGWSEPFGYQDAEWAWVPPEWRSYENPEWDWGILRMPNSDLGHTVGWFTMGILSDQTLMSPQFDAAMASYPGDKPFGTMWLAREPSFVAVDAAFIWNRLDTTGGQSGAAVWRWHDGLVVGIQFGSSNNLNAASRVNLELIAWIDAACIELICTFEYIVEQPPAPPPPPPPPAPDPPASSGPVFASGSDANQAAGRFNNTRARTDQPVETGQVNRTWMWGPHANSAPIEEPYSSAPGNSRVVTYFDKSRMEDNAYRAGPPWDVTNGLLVVELITGRMQVSDHSFENRSPANVQVAGDDHPDSPTYAMLDPLRSWNPLPVGSTVTQRLHPNGSVTDDGSLGQHGVTAGHYVSDTNHTVASVFWNFMNSSGMIFENGAYRHDRLFENPFFATGFPITEAYWVHVPVGGQWQDVLLQCFERRCLTYTPGNPTGWQVEAGNVGQHYYRWRYGDAPAFP